jgi:hypothetical protein
MSRVKFSASSIDSSPTPSNFSTSPRLLSSSPKPSSNFPVSLTQLDDDLFSLSPSHLLESV